MQRLRTKDALMGQVASMSAMLPDVDFENAAFRRYSALVPDFQKKVSDIAKNLSPHSKSLKVTVFQLHAIFGSCFVSSYHEI